MSHRPWLCFSALRFLVSLVLAAQVCLSAARTWAQPLALPYKSAPAPTSFDPNTATWQISWPGRISQYDLVYDSPPIDPFQGMAMGNGDVGVLVWCEESRIIAAVNRSDLWDDAPGERFRNWSEKEEDQSSTLRHACRIIFDFSYPVFNTLYLSGFRGRLSLSDGSISLETSGPFGQVWFQAFVDRSSGLLLGRLESRFKEDAPVAISIERFGSRTFSHWYSQINPDASIGLDGAQSGVGDGSLYILQQLSSGCFAAGVALAPDPPATMVCREEHSRKATCTLSGGAVKAADFTFAVTPPVAGDPRVALDRSLQQARAKGRAEYRSQNQQAWKNIWLRSFMDFGDDYLNRLWHVTMYYAAASQGGAYPGRFTNGLWTWNRDIQPWNFYFHWNQQQLYWPLNAAGHHDLVTPYLNYRFRSLPFAQKDAHDFFHVDGAFISDVTDRLGRNSQAELSNHTPVAEIALDFWRQVQYTGDENLLRNQALPFMIEAAKFYASRLRKEEDGFYHAGEGTGYEGWIQLRDGLTELVYARALFSAVVSACEAAGIKPAEMDHWRNIADSCAALPVQPAGEALIARTPSGFQLLRGAYAGAPAATDQIFAAGWGIKENRWLFVFYPQEGSESGLKLLDGIFPSVPSSPVFPSGLIGLSQKGTPLFEVMATTCRLYSPEVTGWDPQPIVLARLGLADELHQVLQRFPARWQIYSNGWGHWGLEGEVNKDAEMVFRTNHVRVIDTTAAKKNVRVALPMWPFRHMSMESMSVLAAAMNEAALQSHDGVLRLAPAFPQKSNGRFTLHARGGFVVSYEIRESRIAWICVHSLSGRPCRMELPWKSVVIKNQRRQNKPVAGGVQLFTTQPGDILFFLPQGQDSKRWTVTSETPEPNQYVVKHASGKAQLGVERRF